MKNLQNEKSQLFRLSKEVWKSLTYDDIIETARAMLEVKIFNPPYRKFEIECPKEAFLVFADTYTDELLGPLDTAIFYYDLGNYKQNRYFKIRLYGMFNNVSHGMTAEPWNTPNEELREAFHDFYLFVFSALLVVLASKNVVKTQVVNDKKSKSHKQREDSKSYETTTTIKVGKVTEYIGNKPEGSGRTVKAHLRRGHVKGVRIGEGRKDIKKVFIQPCFVNADRDWVAEPRKNYKVVSNGQAFRL
jgi:hypothetical protein